MCPLHWIWITFMAWTTPKIYTETGNGKPNLLEMTFFLLQTLWKNDMPNCQILLYSYSGEHVQFHRCWNSLLTETFLFISTRKKMYLHMIGSPESHGNSQEKCLHQTKSLKVKVNDLFCLFSFVGNAINLVVLSL